MKRVRDAKAIDDQREREREREIVVGKTTAAKIKNRNACSHNDTVFF
jgi:hypothetical protein